jgi:hypothetical protein
LLSQPCLVTHCFQHLREMLLLLLLLLFRHWRTSRRLPLLLH